MAFSAKRLVNLDAARERLAAKSQLPQADLPPNRAALEASDDCRQVEVASKVDLPPNRQKKTYKSWELPKVSVRLSNEVHGQLKALSLAMDKSINDVILDAIQALAAKEDLPPNSICRTSDQLMTDDAVGERKTASSVINARQVLEFYEKHTGNHAKDRDVAIAHVMKGFQGHHVRAGILLSVMRCKGKVNSLKYCLGAVQEAAEANASADYATWLEMKKERAGK